LHPNGTTIIESVQWHGVRQRELADSEWKNIRSFSIDGTKPFDWSLIWLDAKKEIGDGYDWWALFLWLIRSRRLKEHPTRSFCSELVFMVLLRRGIRLLGGVPRSKVADIQACQVVPRDLPLSTLLIEDVRP
jgi:hypothetical protein